MMIERERAARKVDEATSSGTDEAATEAPQEPAPAIPAADDEGARRARFREALDHVMAKHHNVLAALAK